MQSNLIANLVGKTVSVYGTGEWFTRKFPDAVVFRLEGYDDSFLHLIPMSGTYVNQVVLLPRTSLGFIAIEAKQANIKAA